MAIGNTLKKIFKKDQDAAQETAQAVKDTTEAAKDAASTARPKHGEDGVCCGGCS